MKNYFLTNLEKVLINKFYFSKDKNKVSNLNLKKKFLNNSFSFKFNFFKK